jgi:hypothetical protein
MNEKYKRVEGWADNFEFKPITTVKLDPMSAYILGLSEVKPDQDSAPESIPMVEVSPDGIRSLLRPLMMLLHSDRIAGLTETEKDRKHLLFQKGWTDRPEDIKKRVEALAIKFEKQIDDHNLKYNSVTSSTSEIPHMENNRNLGYNTTTNLKYDTFERSKNEIIRSYLLHLNVTPYHNIYQSWVEFLSKIDFNELNQMKSVAKIISIYLTNIDLTPEADNFQTVVNELHTKSKQEIQIMTKIAKLAKQYLAMQETQFDNVEYYEVFKELQKLSVEQLESMITEIKIKKRNIRQNKNTGEKSM